jgi:hypothetical protein
MAVVLHHAGQISLGLTDANGIGVFGRFLGHQRRMVASEEDGLAALAKLARDLVRPRGVVGHEGNPDDSGIGVEIDGPDILVDDFGFTVRRRGGGHAQRAQHGEAEDAGSKGRDLVPPLDTKLASRGADDLKLKRLNHYDLAPPSTGNATNVSESDHGTKRRRRARATEDRW